MASINDDIILIKNKTFVSNSYLICDKKENTCIVVDPGLDADILLASIKTSGLQPLAILSTHGHFDHMGSAKDIQTEYAIPFYMHEADYKMSQSANFFLKVAGIRHTIKTPQPDVLLNSNSKEINIGSFTIGIWHLPGHSPGSCVFKWNNYVLTGDILYKNGLGPESIPKEDKELLSHSILKLFTLCSDDCVVLPGHGSHDSMGSIKTNNLALKQFLELKNHAAN
ncbi:MAG: MBL fold metallo-hydrolase [Bacteroidia bacterium]|nr:MBL fold metallo-hydrolase [Bacteroidia bacterium]